MKMLSIRCPLQLDEDISLQDKDTARLLSEGKKTQKITPKNLLTHSSLITASLYEMKLLQFLCVFIAWPSLCSRLNAF